MATRKLGDGKPSWIVGDGQSAGRASRSRRFCSDCDFAGRIEIHTSEPIAEKTALVYIFRNAKKMSKVGFSQNLNSRVAQVHSTIPAIYRPVYLVRAIRVHRDLAYKIERFTHHLLDHKRVRGIRT